MKYVIDEVCALFPFRYIHLDAEQAGAGSATCGPGVLPQYLVPLKKQSFEFTLYPVK